MRYAIEAITLPVADVDRAKAFYEQAGFNLDVDPIPTAIAGCSWRSRAGRPRTSRRRLAAATRAC